MESHPAASPSPTGWQRLKNRWNQFWFEPVPGYSLAAFRILFGIYLLGYFGYFINKVGLAFSTDGVYTPYRFPDLGLPLAAAWGLYLFFLLSLVLFTVGFVTRLITPIVLTLYTYYFFLNLATKDCSYDRLSLILLAILCFADTDRVWSLTALLRPPAAARRPIRNWAPRLIQLQLASLYIGAGIYKACAHDWQTGEIMHKVMFCQWAEPAAVWIAHLPIPPLLWRLSAWGTIVYEVILPFALWNPRFRAAACISGALFHLSIAVLLNIPEFLHCVAAYAVFWDPRALGERIHRWLGIHPSTPAPMASAPASATPSQ